MDISFSCERCGQDIVIDEAGAGLTAACPTCGYSLTAPCQSDKRPKAIISAPSEITVTRTSSISSRSKHRRLPGKTFAAVTLVALMIGSYFAYKFWKHQQNAPFRAAVTAALNEAHELQSALGVGFSYQGYREKLASLAAKVDDLARVEKEAKIVRDNPRAAALCKTIYEIRNAYATGAVWWQGKLELEPLMDYLPERRREAKLRNLDRRMQNSWNYASQMITYADKLQSELK